MIDFHAGQLTALLSGVAAAGGLLHKAIGPDLDRLFSLGFNLVLNSLERRIKMTTPQNPGMAAPSSVNSGNPVSTILGEAAQAASVAASAASTVGNAVSSASTETAKIEAGIASFLGFALPIVEAIEPAYAVLLSGIGQGVTTILQAIESHQTATGATTTKTA
jgi:hypothetical protein